jgi:nitrogen fixation NifU-like protein
MDHFNAPRNAGPMDVPDVVGSADVDGHAPRVTIYLRLGGEIISDARFTTFGCGVTIAACSMLTELVTNRTVCDARSLTSDELGNALDGVPADKEHCTAVAIRALRQALELRSKAD